MEINKRSRLTKGDIIEFEIEARSQKRRPDLHLNIARAAAWANGPAAA